jgi:hypothetical protein
MLRRLAPWMLLLFPVAVGALVMVGGGASASRWGLHLVAALFGLVAHAAVVTLPPRPTARISYALGAAALVALAGTLAATGLDGVHRWYAIGALRLHPSALLTPMLVVLACDLSRAHPLRAQALLAALQAVHLAQPDAGQASAAGAAALVLSLTSLAGHARVVAALAHLACVGVAWAMPDPLPPAPFVEDIVARALALGLPTAAAAVLSLGALVASPFARPRGDVGPTEGALAACFAASIVATTVGEFPVPLLGYGPSPVVGAFLGLAALRRLRESATGAGRGSDARAARPGIEDVGGRSQAGEAGGLRRGRALPVHRSHIDAKRRQNTPSGKAATRAQASQIGWSRSGRRSSHSSRPHVGTVPSAAAISPTRPIGLSSPGLVMTRHQSSSPSTMLSTPKSPSARCRRERIAG